MNIQSKRVRSQSSRHVHSTPCHARDWGLSPNQRDFECRASVSLGGLHLVQSDLSLDFCWTNLSLNGTLHSMLDQASDVTNPQRSNNLAKSRGKGRLDISVVWCGRDAFLNASILEPLPCFLLVKFQSFLGPLAVVSHVSG